MAKKKNKQTTGTDSTDKTGFFELTSVKFVLGMLSFLGVVGWTLYSKNASLNEKISPIAFKIRMMDENAEIDEALSSWLSWRRLNSISNFQMKSHGDIAEKIRITRKELNLWNFMFWIDGDLEYSRMVEKEVHGTEFDTAQLVLDSFYLAYGKASSFPELVDAKEQFNSRKDYSATMLAGFKAAKQSDRRHEVAAILALKEKSLISFNDEEVKRVPVADRGYPDLLGVSLCNVDFLQLSSKGARDVCERIKSGKYR